MEVQDLWLLAEQLCESDKQSELRTAVNRSYYTAFHETEAILQRGLDCAPPEDRPCLNHSDVGRLLRSWTSEARVRKLGMQFGIEARGLADVFWRCKDEREHADYHLTKVYNPEMVRAHMKRLRKLRAFAEKLDGVLRGLGL